jgi:hypothetical protein
MKSPCFPNALLSALEKSKGRRIRAGTGAHRFIGIWFVVVDGRVMVRSWSIRPEGWYRTFLSEPRGAIQVGKSEIAVRAVPVRNKGLRDLVDRAYLERYAGRTQVRPRPVSGKIQSHDNRTDLPDGRRLGSLPLILRS